MEPRADSALDKIQKKSMNIPAGIEAPNIPSSIPVKNPIKFKITPKDIFGFPTGRERADWFDLQEYEIKEDDLSPIGKVLYARTKTSDQFAFAFMRDYYLLCLKYESLKSENKEEINQGDIQADLLKLVAKYGLHLPEPLVNLTDVKAINKCKQEPLALDNFVEVFLDVFNCYFRETSLSNIATSEEISAVGLGSCKKFIQAELFKASLQQGLIDPQALRIEEKANNPEKSSHREIGEQYQAQLDRQIAALETFKATKLKKTTAPTSSSSQDKQSTDSIDKGSTELEQSSTEMRPQSPHSPDRRTSMIPQSPTERRSSISPLPPPDRRTSTIPQSSTDRRVSVAPPQPLSARRTSTTTQSPTELRVSMTPQSAVEHKTPAAHPQIEIPPSPVSRQPGKTGISSFLGGRNRSPADSRRGTLVQTPRSVQAHSGDELPPSDDVTRGRSPTSRVGAIVRKVSITRATQHHRAVTPPEGKAGNLSVGVDPAAFEKHIDQMIACIENTKNKLNDVLTKSLYEQPATDALSQSEAAKALSGSVTQCMMDHISAYTDLSKQIPELGEQAGIDPKTVGQLNTLASNVVGSSRGLMDLKGCTVRLPIIKGSVYAMITADDIFRHYPDRVTDTNRLGLSPMGEYLRNLAKEREYQYVKGAHSDEIPTFDFLYDLYQLQVQQIHGARVEEALEGLVVKYKLNESPNKVNVDQTKLNECFKERPLRLSNFTQAFLNQSNETLNVTNYSSPKMSIDQINMGLLKIYIEQGLMDSFRSQLSNAMLRQNPGIADTLHQIEVFQSDLKNQIEELQKIYDKYHKRSESSGPSFHKVISPALLQKIEDIIKFLKAESQALDNQFLTSIYQSSLRGEEKAATVTQEIPGFSLESHVTEVNQRYSQFRTELEACTSSSDKKVINKVETLMSKMGTLTGTMSLDELEKESARYNKQSKRIVPTQVKRS